jgi:hypothetical protein
LALRDAQGSAESTAAWLLASLVDPLPAPLRSEPRDIKRWTATATASWVVVLDNGPAIPRGYPARCAGQ